LQLHPDGSADFINHRPAGLEPGVRWICRTADQDALGIVLPATTEPDGYLAEKAKGNLKVLSPGREFYCHLEAGTLTPAEAKQLIDRIDQILAT
jgi:hypothetical protein